MQVRQLSVQNFRGIASLDWKPSSSFCCLIGAGDFGKSTVLDAIEAALSSRWFWFSESDFHRGQTGNAIVIEATVGELSRALMSDERTGLYIRGWTKDGELRDEPEDDDEAVLSVRLSVDATLEPVWELVCDRIEKPRTLSNRDRALFGLIRLSGEDPRHLAWGQGSVLSRLTGDNDDAAVRLAEAYKAARDSAKLDEIEALASVAKLAEEYAKKLGAYVDGKYSPGLELGRSGLSSGSIALHDRGVPLRLAGLGTRRLATLAIQKSAMTEGAIVLVDEIEHGLEPHRIIGAISQLKVDQQGRAKEGNPVGQTILTTHSDIALSEAGAESMFVLHTSKPNGHASLNKPTDIPKIHGLLRFTPRALFARRILLCEGMTEVGLLLGIREFWPHNHDGRPIEQFGSAIVDGNGAQAGALAITLAKLGYTTAIFRDSDAALTPEQDMHLASHQISVIEYGAELNTEQAIFYAAKDDSIQDLIAFLRQEYGEQSVNACLCNKVTGLDPTSVELDFSSWKLLIEQDDLSVRELIADLAVQKKWFKNQLVSRRVAPIVWGIAQRDPESALAKSLVSAEAWLYA